MILLKLGKKILPIVAAAAISSTITYFICDAKNEEEVTELKQQIAELEDTERNALVTKRISEQMEDIAFQQKNMSDEQRKRAEEQSRIADMERGKAEIERGLARKAARKAEISAQQAEEMRVMAVAESERATTHMLQAQASQAKADTLFYKSLGRSLAQTSLQQVHGGDSALASLLSYSAWYYTKEYGGNQYQQDVFASLVATCDADKALEGIAKGNIRGIAILRNDKKAKAIIAVSDYGEILSIPATTFTQWGSGIKTKPDILLTDKRYDFRHIIMTDKEHGTALDINGNIAEIDFGMSTSCQVSNLHLPKDQWQKILLTPDNRAIAVGRKHIAWLSSDRKSAVNIKELDEDINTIGQRADGTVVMFCDGGRMICMNNESEMTTMTSPWLKGDKATAYVFYPKQNYDVIGSESGALYVCDMNGTLISKLLGHTGRISSMDNFSRMIMTASYDRTVRIWDMGNLNTMIVSNEIDFDKWPLCLQYDNTAASLQIGFTDGEFHSLNISAKSNAEHTRKNISREFTPEEWNYYIGSDVPYKTFKE